MQLSWGWQGLEDAPAEREEPAGVGLKAFMLYISSVNDKWYK